MAAAVSAGVLFRVAVAAVTVPAAIYLVARSVLVPITYDEASSYYRYVASPPAALFDFATATNHLLNSALVRVTHAAFGSDLWSLRLPNVIAGFAYLWGAVALARRSPSRVIGLCGLVVLCANPYLLDYFALSRGYGIGVALLTVSTLFLLRWMENSPSAGSRRQVAASLACAGAAVAANFSVLPAFLAIAAVVAARLARQGAGAPNPDPIAFRWRGVVAWALLTTVFSAMVYARERVLSEEDFRPVTVRIAGLFEDELAAIRIFRVDDTGRLRPLTRRPGGLWVSGPVQDDWTLRVVLPAQLDRNLSLLEVRTGDATFRRDRRAPGPWSVADSDSDRVLVSTGELEWRGDRRHHQLVALHVAAMLAALAALAALLVVLARTPMMARAIDPAHARLIIMSIVGVASIAAAPLYLLRRDGQLFFGGDQGVVADTLGSLVIGTTYGTIWHTQQTFAALFALVAAALVLAIVMALSARMRRTPAVGDAATVLLLMALVAAGLELQHRWFDVPYPTGRTALLLLPWLLVFPMLWANAMAALGRVVRIAVTLVMLVLAAGAAANTVRAANVTRTLDWPADIATPAMLDAVREATAATSPSVLRLGVEWMFYPAVRYYTDRPDAVGPGFDVVVLPGDGRPLDFAYAIARDVAGRGTLVREFSESGAVLWRSR